MHRLFRLAIALAPLALVACEKPFEGNLPPVPVPPENPVTEAKRVLGKILFWDEQLSSDDSVACGTCHLPASGGADPRVGIHPGTRPGSIDDVRGSPGIVSLDRHGQPREHPVFGLERQVTPRVSPSNFGALWADALFWDGRAGSEFRDPVTGEVVIAAGGALENQVLEALSSEAEMARAGRTWGELAAELASITPLAMASDLPEDVGDVLAERPGYPALFAAAFGDPEITAARIAFALATYERTLLADAAPWDRYMAGDSSALTPTEIAGWKAFQRLHCDACHVPPLFTNNAFFHIGIRRAEFDEGLAVVTGLPEHVGDFKVPSLRNAGLRPRLMHTGEMNSLAAAIQSYFDPIPSPDRDNIPGFGNYAFNFTGNDRATLAAFIGRGLTDPRVRDEAFPFDRPTLAAVE
ncbi:MAG: cytochrome-c peroxidase [Gammaproteobacteria bacterium]|nr:cytochrome-c peroxidase [Gammaproteobacteria bacterium]